MLKTAGDKLRTLLALILIWYQRRFQSHRHIEGVRSVDRLYARMAMIQNKPYVIVTYRGGRTTIVRDCEYIISTADELEELWRGLIRPDYSNVYVIPNRWNVVEIANFLSRFAVLK